MKVYLPAKSTGARAKSRQKIGKRHNFLLLTKIVCTDLINTGLGGGHWRGVQHGLSASHFLQRRHRSPGLSNGESKFDQKTVNHCGVKHLFHLMHFTFTLEIEPPKYSCFIYEYITSFVLGDDGRLPLKSSAWFFSIQRLKLLIKFWKIYLLKNLLQISKHLKGRSVPPCAGRFWTI